MRRGIVALAVAAAALLAADFFVARHGHVAPEDWPGFLAAYGLVGGCAAVLCAVALKVVLKGKPEEEGRG